MRFGKFLCAALAALLAHALPAGAAPALKVTDAFTPEDCGLLKVQVRDVEPLCGFVSVPLRHGEASSPRIRLAVVVLAALLK